MRPAMQPLCVFTHLYRLVPSARWIIVIILGSLSVIYVLGPKPEPPVYDPRLPELPSDPGALEARIAGTEALRKVKPDNQARIVWFDTLHRKTPYAVVYLHGFSASQEEGDPVHEQFARTFGCNLYLARLAEHGIDTSESQEFRRILA